MASHCPICHQDHGDEFLCGGLHSRCSPACFVADDPATVERVARAIYERRTDRLTKWEDTYGSWRQTYVDDARAALRALREG